MASTPNKLNFHFDNDSLSNPISCSMLNLFQIGDLGCASCYLGAVHYQYCYEISYIVSGSGEFIIDNVAYPVRQGDIIINHKNEEHYIKAAAHDPFRFFYIAFDFTDDTGEYEDIRRLLDERTVPIAQDQYNVGVIYERLFEEFLHDGSCRKLVIEGCMQQLLSYVYRDFTDVRSVKYAQRNKYKNADNVFYEVVNYIDHNLRILKKSSDISQYLGYSYSYISKIFASRMKMTLRDYISQKKIDYAKHMLKSGASVTETADYIQYESIHVFSRAFKKVTGMSPSEYRAANYDPKNKEIGTKVRKL